VKWHLLVIATKGGRRLRVAQVVSRDSTLFANLAEDCPGLAGSATVATVLVRLTELAALVLTVR